MTSKVQRIKCMLLVWSFIPATKSCIKDALATLFPGGGDFFDERVLRTRRTQLQIMRDVFRSKPGDDNKDLYYPFE